MICFDKINSVFAKTFFLGAFILSPILADAQTQSDTTNYFFSLDKTNALSVQSVKHLNTLNFLGDFFYKKNFGKINLAVDANTTNSYFFTTQESFRTAQKIKFYADRSLLAGIRAGIFLSRNYFNDDKRLAISNAEVNQGLLYVAYNSAVLQLNGFGGVSANSQSGITDNGAIYGFEGNIKNYSFENQMLSGKFHFSNEDISPRKNYERNADAVLFSRVTPTFANQLRAGYNELRRDFYISVDSIIGEHFNTSHNIERRNERRFFAEEKILTRPMKNLSVNFAASLLSQKIDRTKKYILPQYVTVSSFDPVTERLTLNFTLESFYKFARGGLSAKINYYEKEETFSVNPINGANEIFYDLRMQQEERKNNTSRLGYITLGGNYELTSCDKFSFSAFHRKLTYDTPSEENFDDRDELLTMFRFTYTRKFSYLFKMNFNLEASQNHVVYIFAERSSNNNIKRILKFSADGIYAGKNVTSKNTAEISANYTVFDFEDLLQNFQSFAYRQVLFRDSSSVNFSKNFGFRFFGYLKLAEQGEFDWNDFAEKPFQFRKEIFAEPFLISRVYFFRFGLGVRYFNLAISDFDELNLIPVSEYTSVGPSFLVTANLADKLNLILHGWYEFIEKENNYRDENLNFNLTFFWKI